MKLNIAYPPHGTQKLIPVDADEILVNFYDKTLASEVPLDSLGEDWAGYVAKLTGGNDKQGFPMMQGVLTTDRVRLLLNKNHKCYKPRRKGERKRKSVRGCIVSSELSVLAMKIVQKGPKDITGLTDVVRPKLRGPRRASKIRKLFGLDPKKDDVRNYVMRPFKMKMRNGVMTKVYKKVKIQRLVTPRFLHLCNQIKKKRQDRWDRAKRLQAIHANVLKKHFESIRTSKSPRKGRKRKSKK